MTVHRIRAVRSTDAGIRVVEQDEPPGEGVEVVMATASICGSDLGFIAMGPLSFVLGHELAGWVDGRPVAIEPRLWCGECQECAIGATQRCTRETRVIGCFSDGGMADVFRVPRTALVPLPESLSVTNACLVEPIAVALHAVRQGRVAPGMSVGVVGGGAVGLAVVACLRSLGVAAIVEARHPHQRAAVERLGGVNAKVRDADVVIEATGAGSGVERGVAGVRPGGRVVIAGLFHGPVPVPGLPMLAKEVELVGSMMYGRHGTTREIDEAATLLAAHPDIADALITHRFPLSEAPRAFAAAADRSGGAIKVVVDAE
ncbi:MAG TPA: zinc-binding dehydrogenase [Microthrixaceae bacterium]|nr:zinc-binding dehydrogenase [Microthrixaceae bacterium]